MEVRKIQVINCYKVDVVISDKDVSITSVI